MKRIDPIKNEDMVICHTDENETFEIKFGKLKQQFISHLLTEKVTKIYLPRTNTYYFVSYIVTKGFKFKKL
ncbi:MAG: hypothetical protein AB7E61_07150 [Acholeplasmataceae bacterium]